MSSAPRIVRGPDGTTYFVPEGGVERSWLNRVNGIQRIAEKKARDAQEAMVAAKRENAVMESD